MTYSEDEYIKNGWQSFKAGREVGVDEGRTTERERIIKLLEERHRPFQNPCNNARCKIEIHTDCVTCGDDYPCLFVDDIALIKEASQKDNETVVLLTEGEK